MKGQYNTMKSLRTFIEQNKPEEPKFNQKLWNGDQLKPEVKKQSIKVGKYFAEKAEVPESAIKDIIVTGSNVGYTYGPHSDWDIHVVVDKSEVGCEELVDEHYRNEKKLFDLEHDVTFYGIPVELYIEDVDDPKPKGSGRYSVMHDKWDQKPQKGGPTVETREVQTKARAYMMKIDDLIQDGASSDHLRKIVDKLRRQRTQGLARDGQTSEDNMVFRAIRDEGYFDKIKEYTLKSTDEELSLS